MELTITARRAHVSDTMRELIVRKVRRLAEHAERIGSCRVLVDAAGRGFRIGLMAHLPGRELYAQAVGGNIGEALDDALSRIGRQLDRALRRAKDRWAPSPGKPAFASA